VLAECWGKSYVQFHRTGERVQEVERQPGPVEAVRDVDDGAGEEESEVGFPPARMRSDVREKNQSSEELL